jgi:cyclase
MLKVRVIPTLLWKDVGLVKGIGFDSWRRIGSLMPAVKVYNTRQVDELMLLDITATKEARTPDCDVVSEISAECFAPLTVGGGIRNLEDINNLLRSGADKVCINSAAFESAGLISDAARHFGSQCVIVSIDARVTGDGTYECYSHCGSMPTGMKVEEWAIEVERLGAGEILITSVEKDGTMLGYDLELTRKVTGHVNIPVIASGGAGNYQHMYEAISISNASAVAAASMFQFTEQTPIGAKRFLASKGIPVRDVNVINQ